MGKIFGRIVLDTSGFRRGVDEVRKRTRFMGNAMNTTLGSTTAKVAGLTAGFLGAASAARLLSRAFGTIADFDQEMANLRSITRGATEETFVAMEKEARRLGATTQFTAGQAAEGMRRLKQGGLSAEESMATLESTLHLAAAGGIDLATASDIAVKQFNVFKKQGTDVTAIVDTLAVSAANSATDVYEMSEGMKYATGIASYFGRNVQEVAAALATMASMAQNGELGGTALRNVLADLSDPTSTTVKSLEKFGVAFDDINPHANSLKDVFGTLAGDAEVMANFTEIFKKRIMTGTAAVATNMDGFDEMLTLLANATGEAEKMASIRMDSLTGDILEMKSALDETFLSTGLKDFFRNVVQGVTDVVRETAHGVKVINKAIIDPRGPEIFRKLLSLAGKSLVNLLVKGLTGVAYAFGRNMIEMAKSTLEGFRILQTKEFWVGLLDVFLGIVTIVASAFQSMMAELTREVSKIKGLGFLSDDADAFDAAAGQSLRDSAVFFESAGKNLADPFARVTKRFQEHWAAVGDSFKRGFDRFEGPFSIQDEADYLRQVIREFSDAVRLETDHKKDVSRKEIKKAAQQRISLESGPKQLGSLAQAINLIFGRSVNDSILQVNKDQKQLLQEIAKNTKRDPLSEQPAAATATAVF